MSASLSESLISSRTTTAAPYPTLVPDIAGRRRSSIANTSTGLGIASAQHVVRQYRAGGMLLPPSRPPACEGVRFAAMGEASLKLESEIRDVPPPTDCGTLGAARGPPGTARPASVPDIP
eukprot:3364919-Rhodomonas_salina.1